MNCAEFRASYSKWANKGPKHNQYPPKHAEWNRHEGNCQTCQRWAKGEYCRERDITPEQHCCLDMAWAISHPILIPHQGRNPILDWSKAWNEYWIPVSRDGYSGTAIKHCPFCGAKLPESREKEWYKRLYALGYDDPGEQDVPEEFHSDKWWRKD